MPCVCRVTMAPYVCRVTEVRGHHLSLRSWWFSSTAHRPRFEAVPDQYCALCALRARTQTTNHCFTSCLP